ncbi:hypothetical protein [Albimonas pacifica]|uniref:Uncharacterized protein n=1 Tax=Albimonas pacifica TaxID=1114924 RepID=A0A1I3NTR0_9RHOB|nr:hypothetical protein [Albimonas pacifica]SFJ12136.1 hypothetical protein SAMN05216258_11455 [Albimonas pacifica]
MTLHRPVPRRVRPALALAALVAAAPALLVPALAPAQPAQAPAEPPAAAPLAEDDGWLPEIPGLDEMTGAAREAIERLREELGPALRRMRDAVAMLDDYGAPEMLPNGDILIPRKEPSAELDPEAAPEAAPDAAPGARPEADGEGGEPPASIDL